METREVVVAVAEAVLETGDDSNHGDKKREKQKPKIKNRKSNMKNKNEFLQQTSPQPCCKLNSATTKRYECEDKGAVASKLTTETQYFQKRKMNQR
jgi:hypothetical protein